MITELSLRVFPDLLFAWHGHSLLVVDRNSGNICGGGLQGLYEHDTRLLSHYRFTVNGKEPRLDALSAVDAFSTLAYYVCAPTPEGEGEQDALGLSERERDRQVVVRVARFVGGGLHEDYEVTNHGLTPARLDIGWEAGADFADLFEARGGERQQEAPVDVRWEASPAGNGELRFDYRHPRLNRGTVLRFETGDLAPRYEHERVTLHVDLAPQESRTFCLKVLPVVDGREQEPEFGCDAFGAVATEVGRVRLAWTARAARLRTANPTVQLAWERAVADLGALALGDGDTPAEKTVPAAGVPLYTTLFGRDALTMAGQAMLISPVLAEGAIRLLAHHIGTKVDDFYDEQPGRVPQQVRDSPLALLGLTTWLHDYGDYAAPSAFLVLLAGHHMVVGDADFTRQFLDPAKRVLDWLDGQADLDGDGFLEYKTRSPEGQKHQGWKDSKDAVRYEDGREVEPPVAACEVQGYAYAARLLMAEVFLSLGEPSRAFGLFRQAQELKERFNERFWMPDERFIAFALDAEKRQVKSISSNAGHCLATGILDGKYAAGVVRRLMAPDMFSGWGVRTLSSEHPTYNPVRYHLGSVWPVENATMAFGMKRYGFAEECNTIARAMFDATTIFEHRRLPEVFGGHARDTRHPHPGIYPDACAPQGWSASAIAWLVQGMLGIWSYAPLKVLFVEPHLPEWLPELTLRDLQVGLARVSIRFKRGRDGQTDYKVVGRKGTVHVLRQPPPGDLTAGPVTRLRELAESLLK